MASSLSLSSAAPPPIFEEALLSGGSNSEFVLNANGSILLDHKAVSRTACDGEFVLYCICQCSISCLACLIFH